MTRSELRAACPSMAVPMPRFRKPVVDRLTLTDAVLRVLTRSRVSKLPFAVFVVDGQMTLCNTQTARYADLERRHADGVVGIYQRGVTVTALVEDLGDWFREVA